MSTYTIGQRKGLGLALGEPLFVVGLDAGRHRVVVGPRDALATRKIVLRDLNWLGDEPIGPEGMDVFVKVRSTRPPQPALISRGAAGLEVAFADAEEGVAPGQACVIYDGAEGQARVLGGGVIASGTRAAVVPPHYAVA
jgi:tRNA-specific 2-thiouridylase